ncbi:MAG: hypothetical protein HY776_08225 [Actinobacteria bacterium]|nr:hypothetical protein [Actinomycetota bacterium]
MLLHILLKMIKFKRKRVVLTILAIFMGATVVASLFLVTSEIANKISLELRKYGANLIIVPEKNYLDETKLPKIKTIFWRHNIVGIVPFLDAEAAINGKDKIILTGTWFNKDIKVPDGVFFDRRKIRGGTIKTGIKSISPWWKIKGQWITNSLDSENALN